MATRKQTKAAVEKAAADVKEAVKKDAAELKKAAEEKVIPKTKEVVEKVKKAVPKKDIKMTVAVEHEGRQVDTKDMVAAVKKEWTRAKHKVADIKSMDLYIKPEEGAVYYVINTTETGRIPF